jgi:large subunit ribosomal protein L30
MPEKPKATGTKKTAKKASTAKAPKRTAKAKAGKATATAEAPMSKVRVRQVRSGIGHARTFRRTLTALGLKHHQAEVVLPDSPSVRGMLFKVRHLVRVTPEEV